MSRSSRRGHRRLAAVTLAITASMFLASCADNGSSGGGESVESGSALKIGLVNEQADPGTPTTGGTLTFSGYSAVTSLDPAKIQVAGATGGSELSAIYDVLMRYDPIEKTFVPQLAQSLEPSSDSKTWTLKLRDGVKFSDGTSLDSKAVVDSINRYVNNKAAQSSLWAAKVASMDTPDASTVVFNLVDPWTGIESMLSTGPGMIVAPAAQQGDQFTPIGAGAFTLERFAPNEELLLAARPDYFGGAPKVDKLKLISIVGAQPTAEALKTGGIDAAYMRTLTPILDLIENGNPGFIDIPSLGYIANVNMAEGRPGSDLRVRQAMAMAIDPETLNTRVNNGKGLPGQVIFQDTSRWHNDVAPTGVDPAKAKELLDQAKADGFDGKVTFLSIQEPSAQSTALGVQAMLNAVGFDTQIEYVTGAGDLVKRMYVDRDYDMSTAAGSLSEADPFERLYTGIKSGGRNNVTNYADAEMDVLLDQLGVATNDEDKKAVLAKIQERATETVPWIVWGNVPTLDVWNTNVHGLKQSIDGIMLFDSVWKS
ncbi:ABC transporter substrate-binding protein [Rhodococcus sp. AD45-ID]|uniref:ABC transporter substrate-binding protein n=1 Tax=Rhodococcus TaxID=1827 RepID=UPI0005D3F2F8|nr:MULTISPECIES: ABC transporter substrate-binding protein [unclassified Rhodococcus (in: high G+C Gram-positive bacteria)]KJF24959.1 Dipeptide-binding protein [Rhodococcus sp. AD45]NRI69659.1 ABC transporter substrate-binding protein [Rhodococcus sp. MS16]PSR43182.1 ABC transporter substrate-binding protein [Rhodococcus sp. AD45-ID]